MAASLTRILLGLACGWAIATPALAQSGPEINNLPPSGQRSVAEAFDRAYFNSAPDFYKGTSTWWQFFDLLGLTNFPENQIAHDGLAVTTLAQDQLYRQTSLDPTLRVADAPNPFNLSLGSVSSGVEVVAPRSVQPVPMRPVPGLY